MIRVTSVACCLATLLSGCQLSRAAEPALLTVLNDDVKQQLTVFLLDIVGGSELQLADDALISQSELYISQRMPLDSRGLPLDGRHSLPAYRFVLLKTSKGCVIEHPRSGKSALLTAASCRVVSAKGP